MGTFSSLKSYRGLRDPACAAASAGRSRSRRATVQITVQSSPLSLSPSLFLSSIPSSLSLSLLRSDAAAAAVYARSNGSLLCRRDGRRTRAHFRALRHTLSGQVLRLRMEIALDWQIFFFLVTGHYTRRVTRKSVTHEHFYVCT